MRLLQKDICDHGKQSKGLFFRIETLFKCWLFRYQRGLWAYFQHKTSGQRFLFKKLLQHVLINDYQNSDTFSR
jgi:hypothetical protein